MREQVKDYAQAVEIVKASSRETIGDREARKSFCLRMLTPFAVAAAVLVVLSVLDRLISGREMTLLRLLPIPVLLYLAVVGAVLLQQRITYARIQNGSFFRKKSEQDVIRMANEYLDLQRKNTNKNTREKEQRTGRR